MCNMISTAFVHLLRLCCSVLFVYKVDYAVRESVSAMSIGKDDDTTSDIASEKSSDTLHSGSDKSSNTSATNHHTNSGIVSSSSSSRSDSSGSSSRDRLAKDDVYDATSSSSEIRSKKDIWRQGRRVTKEDFARYMRFASGSKEVNEKSVDLFFGILDADNDGYLTMPETSLVDEDDDQQGPVTPRKLDKHSRDLRKAF